MASAAGTPTASFRKRLKDFTDELSGIARASTNALHRARVATRRLRELVPVLGLDADVSGRLLRRLRKTTKVLGAVRELDALTLLIEELQHNRKGPSDALVVVSAAVARKRATASQRLEHKLTPTKLRRLMTSLERVVDQLEAEDAAPSSARAKRAVRVWRLALQARLIRRSNQLRAAIDTTGPMYRAGDLHDVRIAVKKLRYGVELSQEAGLGGTRTDLATLKATQDVLGRLHDLEVLIEWARDAQASSAPPELTTWGELASLVRELENECRLLHARYLSSRSKLLGVCDRAAERQPAVHTTHRAVS